MHCRHVRQLKNQIISYGLDPFSDEKPKYFSTGVEIRSDIVADILGAQEKGNKLYTTFVKERLVDETKGIFDLVPKPKICTGIERKKKTPKAVEILKEDKQAFGLMVSQSVNMGEAFKYPITSVPLSVATKEYGLPQSDEVQFTNLLQNASKSSMILLRRTVPGLLMGWLRFGH